MPIVFMPFISQSREKREIEEVLVVSIFVERSDILFLEIESKNKTFYYS